jgi:3-oxoacyl-[acyl-carrier protein] reductase
MKKETVMDVIGLTALVTGSGRGIGRALALDLAARGARVVVHGRQRESCEETAEMIRSDGGEAHVVVGDVTSSAVVESMFAECDELVGGLDVLVNNAGAQRVGWFDELTEDDWDLVVDTNLKAPFLCAQAFARRMRPRRYGRIINIGSESALVGGVGNTQYVAAKAGLMGLTMNVALEMAIWARKDPGDYTCNLVHPGLNETDMATNHSPEQLERIRRAIPLGRSADSRRDVAPVVSFLASREASYVTGAKLSAGGGFGMCIAS